MLLHQIIEFAAASDPDATALISGTERLTFAGLSRHITALADRIADATGPGDRVVVISENTVAMVTALYAVPAGGAIATFANTRHTVGEIAQLIEATTPAVVLMSRMMAERSGRDLGDELESRGIEVPVRILEEMIDPTEPRSVPTGTPTESIGDRPAGQFAGTPNSDEDRSCAWLIHTSGTTGRPKGVMLSHRNLVAATLNTAIGRPMAEDDVYLMPFPLFHVAAYNVLHAHMRRRPIVLMGGFDAKGALDLIRRESVTNCSLAPTMLTMLLDHPDRREHDLDGLRQISYGASSMPRDLLLRVTSELPSCGLAQGYGMTELGGNAVFLTPADHRRAATDDEDLLSAAGRPGPLVRLRIVDEGSRDVTPGQVGEVLVSGDQVFMGYWNAPRETARTLDDGWLHTGDLGLVDDAGYLHVVDRKKDIIITGGENVSSREVEDLLSTHPGVHSVAVIGTPDEKWGELVTAVIVGPDEIGEELIEWTRGRIAGFKRPRRIVTIDVLPVNASGKVDKVALRSKFASDPSDMADPSRPANPADAANPADPTSR